MNKRFSLRWRTLSYFLGTAIAVIVLVLAGLSFLLRNYTVEAKTQEITERGKELAQLSVGVFSGTASREQLAYYFSAADPLVGARIWLLDAERKVAFSLRGDEIAMYPDVTREEFIASWGGDRALIAANAIYETVDGKWRHHYLQLQDMMRRHGVQ